jgi:hypothetical protein
MIFASLSAMGFAFSLRDSRVVMTFGLRNPCLDNKRLPFSEELTLLEAVVA